MLKQKSIYDHATDNLSEVGQKTGILLMALAAVTGMLELPNHPENKIALTAQPVLAFAENIPTDNNPMRREKGSEEAGVTHISYSIAQRTPGRFGKIK